MRRVAVGSHENRGRLAYDPLDPDRTLWCQHVRGLHGFKRRDALRKPIGFRMFALDDGQ